MMFRHSRPWGALQWVIAVLTICAIAAPVALCAGAVLPWQLPEWKHRFVIKPIISGANVPVNTAYVELNPDSALVAADGRDVRLLDENGRPVRFRFVNKDHESFTGSLSDADRVRIQFEVADPKVTLYGLYFDNPDAQAVPPATWDMKLGGLTLETFTNGQRRNAKSWLDMHALRDNQVSLGKGPRRQINDNENPFGTGTNNEFFLSEYNGLIHCPVDGDYSIGTDSDDASFVVIDGIQTVQWADKSGAGHNPAGNFSHFASCTLKAGLHRIEYLHSQNGGGTLARAGWQVPGTTRFVTIPPEAFVREIQVAIVGVESRDNPLSTFFTYRLVQGLQFGSGGPMFQTVEFTDQSKSELAPIVAREWDFGDGTVSLEKSPTHVFAGGQSYTVSLRCVDKLGFESRHAERLAIDATGDTRVNVDMELMPERAILLPGEAPLVQLKCRLSGVKGLSLDVVTEYADPSGAVVTREREAADFAANVWRVFTKPSGSDQLSTFRLGQIRLSLRYLDTPVASRSLAVCDASDPHLTLTFGGDCLADEKGSPVLLQLSSQPGMQRETGLIKLRQGADVSVVALDDSLAGVSGGYSDRMAALLMRKFPRAKVKLNRVGLEGGRTYQPLRNVVDFPAQAQALNADVVIVAASLRAVLGFTPVDQFERDLQAQVERVQAVTTAQVVLVAPPPTIANPGLSQAYAIAVKRVGSRRGVAVADAYSAFMKAGNGADDSASEPPSWRELYRDEQSASPLYHMSPTARGQELIADEVVRAIVKE